ncbi:Protein of unknown function [Alteromonadaceae bacterium Bs31]|nr:Protein of unknown function [Alteromonadaceae bacterium Bs31]
MIELFYNETFLPWIVVVGFCALNFLLLLFVNGKAKNQQREYNNRLREMDKKLRVVISGSLGVGQRIISLEKKLHSLENKQDSMEKNDVDFSYARAQMLIEQGVDVKTVAANSGLSSSEVDLMRMLHEHSRQGHVAVHS